MATKLIPFTNKTICAIFLYFNSDSTAHHDKTLRNHTKNNENLVFSVCSSFHRIFTKLLAPNNLHDFAKSIVKSSASSRSTEINL